MFGSVHVQMFTFVYVFFFVFLRDGKTSPLNTDSSTKPISPPHTPPKVLYESTDSIPSNGTSSLPNQIKDDFDEFDPRSSKAPTPGIISFL